MPKMTPRIERLRVFTIESPSALDFFEGRTESNTLQTLCKLLRHDFASTLVRSLDEFKAALKHATSINPEQLSETERGRPFCLHIAAHGNDSGIALGAESLRWEPLGNCLWDFFQEMDHYPGPIILVISACGASNQRVTNVFQAKVKSKHKPKIPAYVFTTVSNLEGEVYWSDSVVAWSIFYHQIGNAVLYAKKDIQLILDKIQLVGAGQLKYFRWDSFKKQYFHYVSTLKEHAVQASSFKAATNGTTKKPKPRRLRASHSS